jgi:hypothetical protein
MQNIRDKFIDRITPVNAAVARLEEITRMLGAAGEYADTDGVHVRHEAAALSDRLDTLEVVLRLIGGQLIETRADINAAMASLEQLYWGDNGEGEDGE